MSKIVRKITGKKKKAAPAPKPAPAPAPAPAAPAPAPKPAPAPAPAAPAPAPAPVAAPAVLPKPAPAPAPVANPPAAVAPAVPTPAPAAPEGPAQVRRRMPPTGLAGGSFEPMQGSVLDMTRTAQISRPNFADARSQVSGGGLVNSALQGGQSAQFPVYNPFYNERT
jgi:hypothetical protein